VEPRPPAFGPHIQAVDPDGNVYPAFIVGSPHDKKHVLLLTCIPQDSVSPTHDLMMFLGGFDRPSRITRSKRSTRFLAFLYPADDYEELKKRLGSIDYISPVQALQSKPETG
jgi:hypothetical protein